MTPEALEVSVLSGFFKFNFFTAVKEYKNGKEIGKGNESFG